MAETNHVTALRCSSIKNDLYGAVFEKYSTSLLLCYNGEEGSLGASLHFLLSLIKSLTIKTISPSGPIKFFSLVHYLLLNHMISFIIVMS